MPRKLYLHKCWINLVLREDIQCLSQLGLTMFFLIHDQKTSVVQVSFLHGDVQSPDGCNLTRAPKCLHSITPSPSDPPSKQPLFFFSLDNCPPCQRCYLASRRMPDALSSCRPIHSQSPMLIRANKSCCTVYASRSCTIEGRCITMARY